MSTIVGYYVISDRKGEEENELVEERNEMKKKKKKNDSAGTEYHQCLLPLSSCTIGLYHPLMSIRNGPLFYADTKAQVSLHIYRAYSAPVLHSNCMSRNVRKHIFGYGKIQISLHIHTVLSEALLGVFWKARDAKFFHADNKD